MPIIKKEVELKKVETQKEKKIIKPTDLIIPFFSFILFFVLSFFVYIPALSESFALQSELKDLDLDKKHLEELEISIDNMDIEQMNQDYLIISKVIPNKLEVADFAAYIDNLATSNNLKINELRASNALFTDGALDNSTNSYTVSGPIKYTGNYNDIQSFLSKLQVSSKYIITIDSMNISTQPNSDKWFLEMSVGAIYFGDQEIKISSYKKYKFDAYNSNLSLVNIIKQKASEQ